MSVQRLTTQASISATTSRVCSAPSRNKLGELISAELEPLLGQPTHRPREARRVPPPSPFACVLLSRGRQIGGMITLYMPKWRAAGRVELESGAVVAAASQWPGCCIRPELPREWRHVLA